ncbi:TPA: hypothetical protein HA231_04165 [Candidatus Woesearchaeota archaeon]|nr:hypothetical protein [Candidatus Woesearchaeota archaeon]
MRLLPFVILALLLAGCAHQQQSNYGNLPPNPPLRPIAEPQPPEQDVEIKQQQKEPAKKEEPKLTEISLNGDLIIADGEFVINRSRFSLYGNLIVNGTGRLTVVNSEIVFIQDYNQQFRAYFMGNAILDMDNVRLRTGGNAEWFNFDYNGNVTVSMRNVRGNDCCTPWHGASENARFVITNSTIGLTLNNNVTVAVRDKSSMFFELVLANVKGRFALPKGHVSEFRLEIGNNERDSMSIDAKDSSFYHWGTTLDKHTDLTFVDTSITIGMNAGADWQLPSPTVRVSGLKAKKYEDYSLRFDTNELRLLNTEVTSWYPQAWNGATIELADSDLADLQNSGRDSKVIVRDSKVDIAIARENVIQAYYDSEIRQDVIVHDEAKIYLYNTKVGGRILENGNGKVFVDGQPYS